MAGKAIVDNDDSLERIADLIQGRRGFVLNGGAGSGKTYSLVKTLDLIYQNNPKATVACITFTKVAVKEIQGRVEYNLLDVSTIHNFLWDAISTHQKDLKLSLIDLLGQEEDEVGTGIRYTGDEELNQEYFSDKKIQYKEWLLLEKGVISHDELIKLASHMFAKYPLLSKILRDKYNYILVDEYQDTNALVVDVLLNCLSKDGGSDTGIGFFGDPMQAIYGEGIGSLDDHIKSGTLQEVIKSGNRRCSLKVIGLINQIRADGLIQQPASNNKEGSVHFLYSKNTDLKIETIKQHDTFATWDFSDSRRTKELYLTHNLISQKAGYEKLFQIYDKDRIIEHVRKIKKKMKADPALASSVVGKTLAGVLALEIERTSKPFTEFVTENAELYNYAKDLPFDELLHIYLNKDQLTEGGSEKKEDRGDKKDDLIKHLTKIQRCLHLYEANRVYEFIQATDYKIRDIADKVKLKAIMDALRKLKSHSIGEVVEFADKKGLIKRDDKLLAFIDEKAYVYYRVSKISYSEFVNLYDTEEGHNPYSTQHSVKGAEYDNVFVVLDNGRWYDYNFKSLFESNGTESVVDRTRKIFYVCCSRAKGNLVVYYPNPSEKALTQAKLWFGSDKVLEI